jgi:putative phage-type endonuclease
MLTTKQLAQRPTFLGASEAADMCGLSGFGKTPLDVYLSKVHGTHWKGNTATRWGSKLEEVVALAWSEEQGREVSPCGLLCRHPEHDWIGATPDYLIEPGGDILECKCSRTGEGFGESGTDEIPDHYTIQCQWQMLATGSKSVNLAVLIGGQELRTYLIREHKELQDYLFRRGQEFWRAVVARVPPPVDYEHPGARKLLDLLHPPRDGQTTLEAAYELDALDYLRVAEELAEIRSRGREKEREQGVYSARLTNAMGSHSIARVGLCELRRKTVSVVAQQREAYEFVRFTIKRADQ